LKIAILTRPDYRSPRVLAESLHHQINSLSVSADILFDIDVLSRLFSYKEKAHKYRFHFWIREKFGNCFRDRNLINKLKQYDAIIICECTPNGFWKNHYNIEQLKKITNKPVLYYEVYYLGNAPTQVEKLINECNPTIERYDHHLSVANVTEIKDKSGPWSDRY
jgi:hypothetical protein